jgi:hypothetical protein
MTPTDLAALHPRLYHLTVAENLPGITARGLLPTAALLDLFEATAAERATCQARRVQRVPLWHHRYGTAVLTDNLPLHEGKLAEYLDDGIAPSDWLGKLNARVFFWTEEARARGLASARANRGRRMVLLSIDTLSVASAHAGEIELSPINSGATLRRPARRGHATFTPLGAYPYPAWQRLRRKKTPDRVVEVVVRGRPVLVSAHDLRIEHLSG